MSSVRTYKVTNPATGLEVRDLGVLSPEELEAKIALAHETYLEWQFVELDEKKRLFGKLIELLKRDTDVIARQMTEEMGKPFAQSQGEMGMAIDIFQYMIDNADEMLAEEKVEVPGFSRGVVRKEAQGVTLGVEPWNGPVYQSMRVAAPNLLLGNTAIVKPARITGASTMMLDPLFIEAGFPEGAYQTILADSGAIEGVINDDRIACVAMTGSDAVGSIIGSQASKAIKPVVLELGGADPFVVLESADPVAAATHGAVCRLGIGGQVCASPKRAIVAESIADKFIETYVGVMSNQNIGDGMNPDTTLGPLSSQQTVDDLQALYDDAVGKGATVLLAGGKIDRPGFYFSPAVLTGITPEMRLYREEPFGPLTVIITVADRDAAIEAANNTPYGLSATVFGDVEEAEYVARRINAGGVGINAWGGAPVQVPFGGTKKSGVGTELGSSAVDVFANHKYYLVN